MQSGRGVSGLAVVGGGVMGEAIVAAALRAGQLLPAEVVVIEPSEERRKRFAEMGVAARGGAGAVEDDAAVMLAVKPQGFAAAAAEHAGLWSRPRCTISVMAGIDLAGLARVLGKNARLVRAMPNTPARIGLGVTAVTAGPTATAADMDFAETLFACCGEEGSVVRLDEDLFDSFTALAGSGPAYVMLLTEALERAALASGLGAGDAARVARAVVRGSAGLLDGSQPAAALRAAVTSKGGTTEAALALLEREGWAAMLQRAVEAGAKRAGELRRTATP